MTLLRLTQDNGTGHLWHESSSLTASWNVRGRKTIFSLATRFYLLSLCVQGGAYCVGVSLLEAPIASKLYNFKEFP